MTTKLTLDNLTPETLAAISGPRISNVQIADSQYNALDDTAANVGGGYIIINGQSFNSAAQVLIDQTPATTITWVSNTQIRAEIPASTEGASKSVYVINPDGSLALLVNGLTYSAFPAWSTGSTLTSSEALVPISIQLSAPSATVYTLAAANTLPSSLSLYANGLIAGTVAANTTTNYNFTVNAKDAENQDTSRSFTLPITRNVEPAWTTAADLGSAPVNENYLNTLVATDLSSIIYSVAVGSSLPANLTLAANGLLSGSVSTANTYSFAIVATDTANLSNTRTFSISIIAPDPYSSYDTLLLNGEGAASTNGANNSVFIDSSTNNFNIQRNGNATQGTFNPYGYNRSNYFDGTGDYLANTTNNTALAMGSGDFTIEFWMNASNGTVAVILDTRISTSLGNNPGGIKIYHEAGTIYFYGGTDTSNLLCSASITYNTWNHVAIVRSGSSSGNDKMYINGSLANTYGSADTTNYSLGYLNIGTFRFGGTPSTFYTGYISNLRIVKGTAVYTSAFTPPTAPLTAIANTSLLTCQSNRLIDNSPNSFTLTKAGDVSVQAFNPFLQSATSYNPSVNGGSAYFDGTTDFITAVGSGAVVRSSGSFTIEGWYYPTSSAASFRAVYSSGTGYATAGRLYQNNTTLTFYWSGSSGLTGSIGWTLNTWNHFAVTWDGTTTKVYVNGQASISSTTPTYSSTVDLSIGESTYSPFGYISNFRVVNSIVYASAFTPPTSPLTAIANTSLLTCQSNRFIDNSPNKFTLNRNGNVRIDGFIPDINVINENPTSQSGTASFTVTTNPSEPILNSATMVTAIAGGSITNQIRTGSPAVFQGYKPSVVSLDYIDTEITDIHSEALEARVSSLVDIGSRVNPVQFSTTVTNIVHIDTEITDIHSEALEAKVSSVSDLNAKLHVIKSDTSIAGFVAAPTFAYSSGEDVKVSASATQTWYI